MSCVAVMVVEGGKIRPMRSMRVVGKVVKQRSIVAAALHTPEYSSGDAWLLRGQYWSSVAQQSGHLGLSSQGTVRCKLFHSKRVIRYPAEASGEGILATQKAKSLFLNSVL